MGGDPMMQEDPMMGDPMGAPAGPTEGIMAQDPMMGGGDPMMQPEGITGMSMDGMPMEPGGIMDAPMMEEPKSAIDTIEDTVEGIVASLGGNVTITRKTMKGKAKKKGG